MKILHDALEICELPVADVVTIPDIARSFSSHGNEIENYDIAYRDRVIKLVNDWSRRRYIDNWQKPVVANSLANLVVLPTSAWLHWTLQSPTSQIDTYGTTSIHMRRLEDLYLLLDLAAGNTEIGVNISNLEEFPILKNRLRARILRPGEGSGLGRSLTKIIALDEELVGEKTWTICVGTERLALLSALKHLIQLGYIEGIERQVAVTIDFRSLASTPETLQLASRFEAAVAALNRGGRLEIDRIRYLADLAKLASERAESQVIWQLGASAKWPLHSQKCGRIKTFQSPPTYCDCLQAVRRQFATGEGGIFWAPEARARANADLHIAASSQGGGLAQQDLEAGELDNRMQRYGISACGGAIGCNFAANLPEVNLARLDPHDEDAQAKAFRAGALLAGASLCRQPPHPQFADSARFDPVTGVGVAGLFDFFTRAFGLPYIEWWLAGRPKETHNFQHEEERYLRHWRQIVSKTLWRFCDRRQLKRPNRYTLVRGRNLKSAYVGGPIGVTPGWQVPLATRYRQRLPFPVGDRLALHYAARNCRLFPLARYPGRAPQLLADRFDPACTEWLVEIPVSLPYADLLESAGLSLADISLPAQFDFFLQVQRHYATHNAFGYLNVASTELGELARLIIHAIQTNLGYVWLGLCPRLQSDRTDRLNALSYFEAY